MIRLLVIVCVLLALTLGVFALLAGVDPQTEFLAGTSILLFLIIVAVVLLTSLFTFVVVAFVSRFGDKVALTKIHRFVGWKLLRSQRETQTLGSTWEQSYHQLTTQPQRRSIVWSVVGLLCLGAGALMTRPSIWNGPADAISPEFATILWYGLFAVGGLFLVVGLVGLFGLRLKKQPLTRKRQRSAVTLPTFISIVGVSIGIWALIVVLGVMNGLQSDLRDKILRTNAHILIEPEDAAGTLGNTYALETAVRAQPDVVEANAFVFGEAMVSSPTRIVVDVAIKGMTESAIAKSEQLRGRILRGGPEWLRNPEALVPNRLRLPPDDGIRRGPLTAGGERRPSARLPFRPKVLPGILIGVELAKNLNVDVGSEIQLITPDGDIGPTGLRPKLRAFRVAGVFKTGMYQYDQKLAYLARDVAQRFFNYEGEANRLEARIVEPQDARAFKTELSTALKTGFPPLTISDWQERDKTLFQALQLERLIMFIILAFIIIVASLLIVSSLAMLVVEKVKEIAVLKALGASDNSIVRAFVVIGTFIAILGVLVGVPLGIATGVIIMESGIALPREFYITELPVRLDALEVILVGLAALTICLLATIYPSYQASKLRPADGLRHG
ncbi:MAG: lipoprotein-releasing system permease protein [Myxococcota bacterium]|jgi:lipoprotein-releasing system permease protein